MKTQSAVRIIVVAGFALGTIASGAAQGPGGFGMQPEQKVVAQFDKDGDSRLNAAERRAAREFVETTGAGGRGGPGRGFGGRGGNLGPVEPGPAVAKASVKSYPASVPLYDTKTLRTLFLQFENEDWEKELTAFKNTDVEVPATLEVDGKTYRDIGVRFRGASSFMMIPEGRKRSFNLSIDFVHENQTVGGHRTLNLLNANGDPSYLRAVLYNHIAAEYLPTPTLFMGIWVLGGLYALLGAFSLDEEVFKFPPNH